MSDFPADTWGHSQASVSRGSDCSDQLASLPLPAGQLGVWEHSLNSLCVGVACSWNLFFFHSFKTWPVSSLISSTHLLICFPYFSNCFHPPAPPNWHPHALYFSVAGASECYHTELLLVTSPVSDRLALLGTKVKS